MAKKKPPYNRRNHLMTVDILDGMELKDAAIEYGIGTKQAAQKAFRLTAVNLFLSDDREKIIKSNYDIRILRDLWLKSKIGYFK